VSAWVEAIATCIPMHLGLRGYLGFLSFLRYLELLELLRLLGLLAFVEDRVGVGE